MAVRRTLHLTSPHMHDGEDVDHPKDVSDAQYLMNNNVFKQRYYNGDLDGDYGEMTAQGAYRAKYWLGYPKTHIDPHKAINYEFGATLFAYLHGDAKIPALYTWRRNIRLKEAASTPMRELAVVEAKKWVGTKENPSGSNRVMFSLWYGIIGAWCAMFVTWDYVTAKSKAFVKGSRYAYVPYMEYDARMGTNNLTLTRDPQEGDIVCYDWDDDGVSDHTGLFLNWIDRAAGTFHTVEGNTSFGNNSNGGEVMYRDRSLSDVSFKHTDKPAFIHVGA